MQREYQGKRKKKYTADEVMKKAGVNLRLASKMLIQAVNGTLREDQILVPYGTFKGESGKLYTWEDVAFQMGIKEGAAKGRIRKARRGLILEKDLMAPGKKKRQMEFFRKNPELRRTEEETKRNLAEVEKMGLRGLDNFKKYYG